MKGRPRVPAAARPRGTRSPASIARPLASALGRVLKAPNQQTCRSCNRRNSNWSSTTRPPVCSASTFRDQKTIAPPSRCHVVFHTLHAAMKRADHAVAPGIEDQVWWIGYLPDDLRPAHPLRRIARSSSSAPPHVQVGIFIVKNSRKTMAARFCNRQFASPSAQAWDGGWGPATSSLRRRLELGEAFIEGFRCDRPHVDIDHFGQVGGLRGRELARRDRGDDLRRRRHAVGGLIERRQLERDRLALPRRREAVHAQANGRPIASASSANKLSISSVARLREPRGRPAGFPLSPFSNGMAYSFLSSHENTPGAAAACVRATKTRRGLPAGRLAYFRWIRFSGRFSLRESSEL